jgi:hypothetical protein
MATVGNGVDIRRGLLSLGGLTHMHGGDTLHEILTTSGRPHALEYSGESARRPEEHREAQRPTWKP